MVDFSVFLEAVLRIKEIISEDLLRASAASGGQQMPVMPPLTIYPQPPRPVIPTPVPRMPNANSTPGQGHRPAAPHSGVGRHEFHPDASKWRNLCRGFSGIQYQNITTQHSFQLYMF